MATKSKQVFVTLDEFAPWLREAAQELGTHVVLYRGPHAALERWEGERATLATARRAYLAPGSPDLTSVRADDVRVAQLGWVQLDVPRTEGKCLLLVQVATKSDWFDSESKRIMESEVSMMLFDRFWAKWKKRLSFPVWGRNRKTGAEAAYRSIGYSKGAATWVAQGGSLRQEGADNIEFVIRE